MRKEIGKVSVEERNHIKALFERKNGLVELAKIVSPENEKLYEKLIQDLSETSRKFEDWWNNMAAKYDWEFDENSHWEIDFDSRTVYLI